MITTKTSRVIEVLQQAGYDESSIKKVSHYEAHSAELEQVLGYKVNASGIVFVYQDLQGKPMLCPDGNPFVRVKVQRTPGEIAQWEKQTGKKSGKYSCRKESGCRFYFSQINTDWADVAERPSIPIFITEGEKKGDILNQAGYAAIALGGVQSWRAKPNPYSDSVPIKDFDLIKWENRIVFLTPDSDVTDPGKPQIRAAMKELADHLETLGAKPFVIVLPNSLEGYKNGADDFINKYGRDAFDTFVKAAPKALKQAGKSPKSGFILNVEPPTAYRQAEIMSILLSENYAYREDIGWYKYGAGFWSNVGVTYMRKVFVKSYHNQHWDIDSAGSASYIEKILPALTMVDESKWNAPGFMLYNNGLYNPLLKVFSPVFRKDLYITYQPLDFPFCPEVKTPELFLKYLHEACAWDIKTVELIQAILKYVWLPKDKTSRFPLEYAFDFYGGKGTGKSTLIEVILAGLGQDNVADAAPSVFATPESVSQLIDKKAAVSPDTHGFVANPEILNKVISNEQMTVRKLYHNPVFIRLGVTIVRAYNKIMSMGQGGEGQDRRLIVIEFNNKPKKVDIDLSKKLAGEMPQIMNWAFNLSTEEMIHRIRTRNGSKLADRASAERFAENNPVFSFLEENYQEGNSKGVKINELYAQYRLWGENQGMQKPVQQRAFKAAITSLGCTIVVDAEGNPVKPQGYYKYSIPVMSDFDMNKHLGYASDDNTEPLQVTETVEISPPVIASAPEVKPFPAYLIPDSLEVLSLDDGEDMFKDFRYMNDPE